MLKTLWYKQKIDYKEKLCNKKAFTLIELIMVIVILWILSAISFLNFSDYWPKARDSVRISDFRNIEKTLELYRIKNSKYPEPDELETWEQWLNSQSFVWFKDWKIWERLWTELWFWTIPKDPKTKSYYKYSVSEDKKIYLMKLDLETRPAEIVWNIPTSCKNLKDNNAFKWNWIYTLFHENIEPRQVYCHENYDETFQLSTIWWDMEKILWDNENNQRFATFYEWLFHWNRTSTKFVTDEKYSWERSLKVEWAWNIARSDYIYIDPNKNYKISWKFKVVKKDKNNNDRYLILLWIENFSLVDWNIKYISPGFKNYQSWTETKLARDLNKNDKKLYFECNQELYELWKKRIDVSNVIAFDVDPSWALKDLPNKNLSNQIWKWLHPTYWKVSWFLQVEWWANWWANKEEIKTCVLNSHFAFWKSYPAWTNIRKHFNNSNSIWIVQKSDKEERDWWELNLEWILKKEQLWILDNFAKISVVSNYNARHENWIVNTYNDNTITYIDDLKFEVID